jgi:hypothetical protein
VIADNKAGVLFFNRPRSREATFGHVTTPCEQVKELFAFVGQHIFSSIIGDVEGYQRIGYPRCKIVEEKKSDPIGGSPWNMLGGNSENFIRPQTRRRGCALYSPRSVDGRARCAETINRRISKTTAKLVETPSHLSEVPLPRHSPNGGSTHS